MRVDAHHCATYAKPEATIYCVYPNFAVQDSSTGYRAVVPEPCMGNQTAYDDGWVRWEGAVGPVFQAIDSDNRKLMFNIE